MKVVHKYIEIYIMTLLVLISAVLFVLSIEKYESCDFYLGYTVENNDHKIVLWSFNNDKIRQYCSYNNYSEQYHTSVCTLDEKAGKISDIRICFDSSDGNISIAVLTIVCNGYSVDYYPQDILEKFFVQNAEAYSIDENGFLQIVVSDENCLLVASEDMCAEINAIRR